MEPLTALGLAANLLQFVEVGYTVISSAIEIHNSKEQSTAENADLLVTFGRLEEVSRQLKPVPSSSTTATTSSSSSGPGHEALQRLAEKCHALSLQLLQVLTSLRVDKRGASRQSFSIAWLSWWKKSDIAALRGRLDEYRSQILLEVNLLLKKDQSRVHETLTELFGTMGSVGDQLDRLETSVQSRVDQAAEGNMQAIGDLRRELTDFHASVRESKQRDSVLRAIRFDKMEERFDDVKKEHAATFDWIFERPHGKKDSEKGDEMVVEDVHERGHLFSNFREWLGAGSGIFHIEGKAGSGKSTLMKFVCRDERTEKSLRSWADKAGQGDGATSEDGGDPQGTDTKQEKALIFGHFFFWKPGSKMQRSLKGLTRSLLHSILEQAPELIPITFPEAWKAAGEAPLWRPFIAPLGPAAIEEAFFRLVQDPATYTSRRFCFFIDGLDEYDESNGLDPEDQSCYADVIRLFSTWTKDNPDVKLCVSSRDWELFKDAFSSAQRLRLQDLTRHDMELLVRDTLAGGAGRNATLKEDAQFPNLVDDIVRRAEGVFLWVVLVLKSLRQGLQHRDSVKMLRRRLDRMPLGLESFLGFMVEQIGPEYLPETTLFFATALTATRASEHGTLSLLRFSFLEELEDDPKFAVEDESLAKPADEEEIRKRLEGMRFRLDACCRGLLQVTKSEETLYHTAVSERVSFLHRSVHDFLEADESELDRNGGGDDLTPAVRRVKRMIADRRKGVGQAHLLVHSFIAELKSLRPESIVRTMLGKEVADAGLAIQRSWTESGVFDWATVEALDQALLRPIDGAVANLRDPERAYFVVSDRYMMQQGRTPGSTATKDFVDLVGTMAVRGHDGLLLSPEATPAPPISHPRNLDYLLRTIVNGFEELHSSSSGRPTWASYPTYHAMLTALAERGADPNGIGFWDDVYATTGWELFLDKLLGQDVVALQDVRNYLDGPAGEMMQHLLEMGADPYSWWVAGKEVSRNWIHTLGGGCGSSGTSSLFFHGCNPHHDAQPKPEVAPASLRRIVELGRPPNMKRLLELLPGQEDYDRVWADGVFVSGAFIRAQRRSLPSSDDDAEE